MKKILSLALALCLLLTLSVSALADDGVFAGEGKGHGEDPIKVEITVADGAVTDVSIVSHSETPGISDPALERIPQAIVDAQSADVDTVASATESSNGIIAAVKAACEAAGLTLEG